MGLLNNDYVRNVIHRDAAWAGSHGADGGDYLGAGLFYYAIAYMLRARTCVCLGSAGGFVPRLMRQAQRDLGLVDARTVLVDANIGHTASGAVRARGGASESSDRRTWGMPRWVDERSFFRTEFSDIDIIIRTTKEVATSEARQWRIDYLHIDADYSYEGRLADFLDYAPFMSAGGAVTLHDTDGTLPCSRSLDAIRSAGHEVVNFPGVGRGVALIRNVRPPDTSVLDDVGQRGTSHQGAVHRQGIAAISPSTRQAKESCDGEDLSGGLRGRSAAEAHSDPRPADQRRG